MNVQFKPQSDYLLITLSGVASCDEIISAFKEIFEAASQEGSNKILVNCLSLEGEISTMERHRIGIEATQFQTSCGIIPRVAVLGKAPTVDGFAALVSNNRGGDCTVVSGWKEALDYLNQ